MNYSPNTQSMISRGKNTFTLEGAGIPELSYHSSQTHAHSIRHFFMPIPPC